MVSWLCAPELIGEDGEACVLKLVDEEGEICVWVCVDTEDERIEVSIAMGAAVQVGLA